MIGHTQLFLWSRYSDIISLLTITVRGYQISIAYCLFSLGPLKCMVSMATVIDFLNGGRPTQSIVYRMQ